jgi:hypothetical protein
MESIAALLVKAEYQLKGMCIARLLRSVAVM